jgi:plasmid stabilization system protein ParE
MLDRLAESPGSFPPWPGVPATPVTLRRAVVSRFPYVIAFHADADRALVLAVAHAKRRPLYWLTRLA